MALIRLIPFMQILIFFKRIFVTWIIGSQAPDTWFFIKSLNRNNFYLLPSQYLHYSENIYLFKVNNRNTTIMVITFWDFLIFDQLFLSPQVKWGMIISNSNGMQELAQELPNDFDLGS